MVQIKQVSFERMITSSVENNSYLKSTTMDDELSDHVSGEVFKRP